MKIKLLIWIPFIFFLTFLPTSKRIYADTGYINDDIKCNSIEITGEDSLYVNGDLTYYVEEDKSFKATIIFYSIFDKVLAKAYIKVTLKENDNSVSFDEPIYIDHESDSLEVKSTHHIGWQIDAIETIECCINHAGIIGCDEDSGKLKCYNGEISKDCKCEEYNILE